MWLHFETGGVISIKPQNSCEKTQSVGPSKLTGTEPFELCCAALEVLPSPPAAAPSLHHVQKDIKLARLHQLIRRRGHSTVDEVLALAFLSLTAANIRLLKQKIPTRGKLTIILLILEFSEFLLRCQRLEGR